MVDGIPEYIIRMIQLGFKRPECDEDIEEFVRFAMKNSTIWGPYETKSGIDYSEFRVTNTNSSFWIGSNKDSIISVEFTPTLSYNYDVGIEEIIMNSSGIPEFLKIWIDPMIENGEFVGLVPLIVKLPNPAMFKFDSLPYIYKKLPLAGILDQLTKFTPDSYFKEIELSEESLIPIGLFNNGGLETPHNPLIINERSMKILFTGKLSFISQEENRFTGTKFWNLQINTLIGKIVFTYFRGFEELGLKEGDVVTGIAGLYSSCDTVGWKP